MREQTVATHYLLGALLTLASPVCPLATDARCRLSEAQVLTTALEPVMNL